MHIHCVQMACIVWACNVTSVASRPLLIAWGFGHKGAKTYDLQQDGGDSDVRGGHEAMQSRGAHTAGREPDSSCSTRNRHAVLHARSPRVCHVPFSGLGTDDFGGISVLVHSVGLGAQGCKTYGLQQDGGDSSVCGGDEAVHSHDARMACVNQAVTHAITTQCCMHIH